MLTCEFWSFKTWLLSSTVISRWPFKKNDCSLGQGTSGERNSCKHLSRFGDSIDIHICRWKTHFMVVRSFSNLVKMVNNLLPMQILADTFGRETLLWKLKLLDSASLFANAHLHLVQAQTLILSRFLISVPSNIRWDFHRSISSRLS